MFVSRDRDFQGGERESCLMGSSLTRVWNIHFYFALAEPLILNQILITNLESKINRVTKGDPEPEACQGAMLQKHKQPRAFCHACTED